MIAEQKLRGKMSTEFLIELWDAFLEKWQMQKEITL